MDNGLIHSTGRRGIKEQILKLREEKLSYRDIAKKLKCSKSTISYHCNNNECEDIGLQTNAITETTRQEIFEFSKTHTVKEAMEHFTLGRTSIKRYKYKKHLHDKL